jgi:DNA end-binding protein Ku
MARSMWRGAIQWGLVTLPIKLYLATESRAISFNMLHETCLNRIQMRTWCPHEDEQISRGDTVRGYEYSKGQYVVITDEDLASVPLSTVRAIEVERFVPATPVGDEPPRYVKQTYYVEPEPLGRRAYALFREVLSEKDLVAICKVMIKDREALAALSPRGPVLVLETLHWPDEIRSYGELDLPDEAVEVKPAELAMAAQLIEPMMGTFDPAAFRDEYRAALEDLIAAKVEGREVVVPAEPEAGGGQLADLMAMLEASVKAATAAKPPAATKPAGASKAAAKPPAAASKVAAGKPAAAKPASAKAAAVAKSPASAKAAAAKPTTLRVATGGRAEPAPARERAARAVAAEPKAQRRRSA